MSKKNIYVFCGLMAIGLFAYRNCFNILIPADDYGLFYLFKNGIILGFDNKELASPPYLVSFPILFGLFQVFGMNPAGWVFTAVLLHVINAFLVLLIAERAMKSFLLQNNAAALFAAFIFLLSPYQTEAVLWAPTDLTILLATGFFLSALWQAIVFFETNRSRPLILSHCLFLLAVFSYEISFVLPGIAAIFFILYRPKTKLAAREFILKVLLPQTGILFSYAAITRLVFGEWIWHAGSMELSVSFPDLAVTLVKYLAKFFIFFRYLPLEVTGTLAAWFGKNHMLTFLFTAALGRSAFFILKRKQNGVALPTTMFMCFLLSLLPVLPLDSSFLKYIYTDRYGYLPSVFFYMFLSVAIFLLFRKFSAAVLTGYAALCLVLLMQTTGIWSSVNDRCNRLIKDYAQFLNHDRIYVLDVPAYSHGIAAFRTAFDETMYMKYNTPHGKNIVISGSYHDFPLDTLLTARLLGNTIEVKSNWRTSPYFSTNCGWAETYETDEYMVDFAPNGCSYLLTFKKEIPANSVFIFATENGWKKVE